jgi:ADP-heptose:LPS heptosyltransferase
MKLLIIRFSSIGDIVLTSPVLRCLKEQLKDVELHFAVKHEYADLVRFDPHVDKVHELKDHLGALVQERMAERSSTCTTTCARHASNGPCACRPTASPS